jgi:hypothetical protein
MLFRRHEGRRGAARALRWQRARALRAAAAGVRTGGRLGPAARRGGKNNTRRAGAARRAALRERTRACSSTTTYL